MINPSGLTDTEWLRKRLTAALDESGRTSDELGAMTEERNILRSLIKNDCPEDRCGQVLDERDELRAEIEELSGKVVVLRRLLKVHRRFHGKVACADDECFVCVAENE